MSEFHAKAPKAIASEGLAEGPYLPAREGSEVSNARGDRATRNGQRQ